MSVPLSRMIKMTAFATVMSLSGTLCAGTLVVDWGGDYVSSYTSLKGTPASETGSSTYAYSYTTPLSPDGTPTFYGGASVIYTSGSGAPTMGADRFGIGTSTGGNNVLRLGTGTETQQTALYGMIFFKKEDFVNGGAEGSVTLDSDSTFKIGIASSSAGSGSGQVRRNRAAVYALRDGEWGWYVSYANRAGGTSHTFGGLGDELWQLYDPETTPFTAPTAVSADYKVLGSSFEAIDAIGFFFEYVTPANGGAIALHVNSFSAEVAAIPEPSTVAFILGGGVLLAGARRYHRVR